MRSRLTQLFGIDLRTLAWVRIALATLVLVDLAGRARHLSDHYTDRGVIPRASLIADILSRWEWSLHLLNGTFFFQSVLFLIAAGFAFAMLVGYRTRLTTVATWVLLCSVQTRNPAVYFAGDDALRLFIFWSMFLPLGATWSVDASRAPQRAENPNVSWAGFAFMAQVAFIYVFTVIHKHGPQWFEDFSAVYYALSLDEMLTPLGEVVRGFPGLMKAITIITIVCEAAAPILIFSPFQTARVRVGVILVMMALHLGMGLCLVIGMFPFVIWAGWWIFIPGELWDWLGARAGLPPAEPRTPAPPSASDRAWHRAANVIVTLALAYVLLFNLRASTSKTYSLGISQAANAFGTILQLKQNWGLFAPSAHPTDGWYVVAGELENGENVDLFRDGAPTTYERPKRIADDYPNVRWQKFMVALRDPPTRQFQPHYVDHLCQRWNEAHLGTDRLVSVVSIFFMEEYTLPDGGTRPVEKRLLIQRDCP